MITPRSQSKQQVLIQTKMFFKYLMLCLVLVLQLAHCIPARKYEFIPARCNNYPGVEAQIGGPLSLCSFPPKYETPDNEDIRAVIKHIQGLNLN
ncbi:uncharacterized protein [Drosophila virilis]|nr:uncharacterized protein LOC6628245 [Drosophila virilis]KRF81197.1 uncharacterized protein Dvir_GJ15761, isoform B [Drosophila virilis]